MTRPAAAATPLPPEFFHELTAINLHRSAWLIRAGLLFTAATLALAYLGATLPLGIGGPVLMVDLLSAAAVLALGRVVGRLPPASPMRPLFVFGVIVCFLGYMDIYYLSQARVAGTDNPNYVIGVVLTGALFLLPPRLSIPLFTANHAQRSSSASAARLRTSIATSSTTAPAFPRSGAPGFLRNSPAPISCRMTKRAAALASTSSPALWRTWGDGHPARASSHDLPRHFPHRRRLP